MNWRNATPPRPVEYGGFLRMPALAEAVREFRALLMTPKWLEAFGIVGIEALACGTPVIAYRRGGISDYVRDGETGWLVEPDDLDRPDRGGGTDRADRPGRLPGAGGTTLHCGALRRGAGGLAARPGGGNHGFNGGKRMTETRRTTELDPPHPQGQSQILGGAHDRVPRWRQGTPARP